MAIGTDILLPGAGAPESLGDYYLLVAADPAKKVKESNEKDNAAIFTGTYHPLAGGVFVQGTAGADVVTLAPNGLNTDLSVNGPTTTYPDATGFALRLHDGDDSLDGKNSTLPISAWGGAGNDSLIGGGAADVLNGGIGDDVVTGHVDLDIPFGPVFPLPGGVTAVGSGTLGLAGGRTFDYSNFDFPAFRLAAWMPVSVKVAMDGSIDAAGETLTFDPASLSGNTATWNGSTHFFYDGVDHTVNTRFTLAVVDTNNAPLNLFDATVPLGTAGTAVGVTGPYRANFNMEAFVDGSWQPVRDLFDSKQTDPSASVLVSFSGAFTPRFLDNDSLSGGLGNDVLTGNDGNDVVVESADANFTLAGDAAAATLAGVGTDSLFGIEQASLTGGKGKNVLDASAFAGPVTLDGGLGNDSLLGGAGNDRLIGGRGKNAVDGGAGTDTVAATGNFNFKLTDTKLTGPGNDTLANMEAAQLTGGEEEQARRFRLYARAGDLGRRRRQRPARRRRWHRSVARRRRQ